MTSLRNVALEFVGCDMSCTDADGSDGRKPCVWGMERRVPAQGGSRLEKRANEDLADRASDDVQEDRSVQTRDVFRLLHSPDVTRDRGDSEG